MLVDAVKDDAGVYRRRSQDEVDFAPAVESHSSGLDDSFEGALPDHFFASMYGASLARKFRRDLSITACMDAQTVCTNGNCHAVAKNRNGYFATA
jgi:hypothetical protein